VGFELCALERLEFCPCVVRWHADIAVVGGATVFIGHLEEDQVGELLEIVAVAHAVIAQGGAETPNFRNDAVGGHGVVEGLRRRSWRPFFTKDWKSRSRVTKGKPLEMAKAAR